LRAAAGFAVVIFRGRATFLAAVFFVGVGPVVDVGFDMSADSIGDPLQSEATASYLHVAAQHLAEDLSEVWIRPAATHH
jgi:hypothetical protein